MKNVWKGLVLGAVTGAAVGAGIDRRSGRATPDRVLAQVVASVPGGADIRDGLVRAADRLRDADAAQPIGDAAEAVRQKAGAVVADGRATDVVRDGAGSAVATGRELAHAVRDKAGHAAAESKEAVSTIASGPPGS